MLKRLKKRHEELGLSPDSTLFHSKRDGLIKNPRKWFATALEQAEIGGRYLAHHAAHLAIASQSVTAKGELSVHLAPGGGLAVIFTPKGKSAM